MVRGAQQAGQSQAGLQPPRPAPARLHALPPSLSAAPASRARLHRHPPREEAAAETQGCAVAASEKPQPCQVPAEVSLRVAHCVGDASAGETGARAAFRGDPVGHGRLSAPDGHGEAPGNRVGLGVFSSPRKLAGVLGGVCWDDVSRALQSVSPC